MIDVSEDSDFFVDVIKLPIIKMKMLNVRKGVIVKNTYLFNTTKLVN